LLRAEMAAAAADAERTSRAAAAEAKDMRETISKLQAQLAGLDGVCYHITLLLVLLLFMFLPYVCYRLL
jgi:membrane-associated protease RseP (regulator of RpoE activity)